MKFRVWILLGMVALFLPSLASASCAGNFYASSTDGRAPITYFAPASTAIAVFAIVDPGHSYSVEMTEPFEDPGSPALEDFFVNVIGGGDCVLADSGATFTDTTGSDPALYTLRQRRVSFVAGTGYVYAVINNRDGVGRPYRVKITDTTMYNSAWSTIGGNQTFYSIVNTTNHTIHASLTMRNTGGTVAGGPFSLTIPAGTSVSTNSGLLVVGSDQKGFAILTHDGPPHALIIEAAIANLIVTPNTVQPVKFVAVRESE